MTSFFPFTPNVQAPFSFQPTLDGDQFSATVPWNLFGQRWYINLTTLDGTLVFALPLIGSPDGVAIESASWSFGKVTLTTSLPHNFTVGQTVELQVFGFLPDAYNGTVLAFVVDPVTLVYSLSSNPGDVTQFGAEIYNINLAGGYFDTSTLVFRQSSQTFEVTP